MGRLFLPTSTLARQAFGPELHLSVPPPGLDPTKGHVKGAAVREFLVWYEERYGRAALVSVYDRMPSLARVAFDPRAPALGLLPATWYPSPAFHGLFDAMMAGRSAGERSALVRAGARATMERLLSGVYRVLFNLVPQTAPSQKGLRKQFG